MWHSDDEYVRLRDVVETLCYMTDEDSDGVEEVMQLETVELISCKDCKHRTSWLNEPYCDRLHKVMLDDDFYCGYAERKEQTE